MTFTEFALIVGALVSVIGVIGGLFAFIAGLARIVYLVRNRGMPTAEDYASAPNLRWHSPAVVREEGDRFEVRCQCTNSGTDAQGAEILVEFYTEEDRCDAAKFYNPRGIIKGFPGEFTLRIPQDNGPVSVGGHAITWRLIYFDAQARYGYVSDNTIRFAYDSHKLELGPTMLDLTNPRIRHQRYRKLPKHQRRLYESLFAAHAPAPTTRF